MDKNGCNSYMKWYYGIFILQFACKWDILIQI